MPVGLPSPTVPVIAPAEIVRAVRHLPSAPKILPRLKLLLRDGNSALDEIVGLVRLDPGLAMRVLQIGNSPYFFTGARCFTVDEAVRRVGFDEIYSLVSYAVAAQVLNRPLVVYGIEPNELWARSVGCALAAEAIAEVTGDDQAVAYTLGLLHGVGMIAIDEWALRAGRDVRLAMEEFPGDATKSELAQLGFTHADVGGGLLEEWEFPTEIVEPVACQHAPRAAVAHPKLAALLYASKWIRAAVQAPRGTMPPLPSTTILRPLNITAAKLKGLVSFVSHELTLVSTSLDEVDEMPIDRPVFPAQMWRG
jgi:HD-like signal output (HDOD) protein